MSTHPHARPRPDTGTSGTADTPPAPGVPALLDVEGWYRMLDAPAKDVVVLETSGHRPMFEQPDEFVANLTDVVLPAVATGEPSS